MLGRMPQPANALQNAVIKPSGKSRKRPSRLRRENVQIWLWVDVWILNTYTYIYIYIYI
jgi:hypothetical protein